MARWWESPPDDEFEPVKSYKECPKCKAQGDPGTECLPWTWVTFVNGVRREYAMSTPLCSNCRAERVNPRQPAYTGTVGGGGFSKYEFRSQERAKPYEPLPMGTLERSRMEYLERTAANVPTA